mgnify:CR=1 FL=1
MSMKAPTPVPVTPGWLPDPMRLEPWEEQDEPLASERHHQEQDYCLSALRELLRPQGYLVTRDRWLRVDPTGVQRPVQPDLLIAHGVTLGPEETTYDPWLLDKAPDLLAEFLSPTTATADLEGKPRWYAALGVREFFRFDLSGIVQGGPPLAGFALTSRRTWAPLPLDPDGGLTSRVLGVRFVWGDHLTIIDLATGRSAPRSEEVMALLRQAERARWPRPPSVAPPLPPAGRPPQPGAPRPPGAGLRRPPGRRQRLSDRGRPRPAGLRRQKLPTFAPSSNV